jgi:M6 family metalloprotease-like protein
MKYLSLLLLLFSSLSFAAPFHGLVKSFRQPNGQSIDVKLFGTELYLRAEGMDGYTLVRDSNSKWICYAQLSRDGIKLKSTGRKYLGLAGKPETWQTWTDIPKHLDIPGTEKEKTIEQNAAAISGGDRQHLRHASGGNATFGTPIHPVEGQIKGLCILIDFSDEPATLPQSEFVSFCNDLSYNNFGNNGSLRTYFRDVSKGKVDYTNIVVGFYRAPRRFSYYDSLPYAQGAQCILKMALEKLDSSGFDFSTLSINPEDNTIMAINLMYTGEPPVWAQGMWHHKGYLNNFTSSSGIKSGDYNCSPANDPLGIGVVAHENGHMIGKWPDTYKYNSDTGPDGIGAFDLMCWYGSANNPVPPNPLFRLNAGWGKRFDISDINGQINDTSELGNVRYFRNENDSMEFYLLEARRQLGRSQSIPDEGLTIWRINRNGNNQTTNHEVNLVPANNNFTNQDNACFRAGFRPNFHNTTTPSSKLGNGDPSGMRITTISSPGEVMSYNAGPGTGVSVLKLFYIGVISDGNNNGMLEPGENFTVGLKVKNTGTVASGNLVATCQRISPNQLMVNLINPNIPLSPVAVAQEQNLNFEAQIAATAEVGKEITLRFQIAEGGNTVFITRKFLIGTFHNMVLGSDSLCNTLFFDPGGLFTYPDNTTMTQVIYPKLPNHKVQVNFMQFDLEESPNCQYDFLRIFNGTTTNAPLLGTFCGNNSPGTITSTHSSGALTFRFRADEGVSGEGWMAVINCLSVTEVQQTENNLEFFAYPNPMQDFLYFPSSEKIKSVLLFDAVGKLLHSQKSEEANQRMEVSHLAPGLYWLQVKTSWGIKTQKMLKK